MKTEMNEYLKTLYRQIGRGAFLMMNAQNVTYDNKQNVLKWDISGSPVAAVRVTYKVREDLYELGFFINTPTHLTEVVIEQVEVSQLHETIERITGLSLRVPRIQFAN